MDSEWSLWQAGDRRYSKCMVKGPKGALAAC
jgi:hypothetical protein